MSSETIDVEYERDLVATALKDLRFVKSALPVVKKHQFSDRALGWIWSVVAETVTRAGELPTARVFSERLDRDYKDEESAAYVMEVLLSLNRRKVAAPRTALERVRDFVRMVSIRGGLEGGVDGLDRGDLTQAEEAIKKGIQAAREVSLMSEPVSWGESVDVRLGEYTATEEKVRDRVKTPLPTLNRFLNGGLRPGSMGLLVANTNVGKSSFAVDIGYTALAYSGAVVVHIVTEETLTEGLARYDARLTGIDRGDLLSGRMTPAQEKIYKETHARKREMTKRLFIHELPPKTEIGQVKMLVELAREKFPDRPLLIVVDSPDHLTPGGRMENFRLGQSDVHWTIKAMVKAEELSPCMAWVTTQAPKAFEGKTLTTGAASETYDKSRITDVMLGVMESNEGGPATGDFQRVEFILVKNRLGGVKKAKIWADGHMGTCRFEELESTSLPGGDDGKA